MGFRKLAAAPLISSAFDEDRIPTEQVQSSGLRLTTMMPIDGTGSYHSGQTLIHRMHTDASLASNIIRRKT